MFQEKEKSFQNLNFFETCYLIPQIFVCLSGELIKIYIYWMITFKYKLEEYHGSGILQRNSKKTERCINYFT